MIFKLLLSTLGLVLGQAIFRTLYVRRVRLKFIQNAKASVPMYPFSWLPCGDFYHIFYDPKILTRLNELHARLGNTFGWMWGSQPIVFTTDLELIKTMVVAEANEHINRIRFYIPVPEVEYDSIAFANGAQWRRIRRAMAPSFTKHTIMSKNVVDEIESVVEKLIVALEGQLANKEYLDLNTDKLMLRHTTDVIMSLLYKQYNSVDYTAKEDPLSDAIERGMQSVANLIGVITVSFPYLTPVLSWLAQMHPYRKLIDQIMDFIKQQTALNLSARHEVGRLKRNGMDSNPDSVALADGRVFKRNMIDPFIDSFHEGKLSKVEFLHTSVFLYQAGIITMADVLSRMLFRLALNQTIQVKLRDAIMRDGIESEYLSWCILETIRLDPPVPTVCSRLTERDIQTEDGKIIPKGTYVHTSAYSIHRSPEHWGADALEFKPERWQLADTFRPIQFLGFGLGPRACPGKALALFEMRKVIEALLVRFKFDRCEMSVDSDQIRAPYFLFVLRDLPTCVRISKLGSTT